MVPAAHPSLHFNLFYFKLSAVSLLGKGEHNGEGARGGLWGVNQRDSGADRRPVGQVVWDLKAKARESELAGSLGRMQGT